MLTKTKTILEKARRHGYAVPAFNINNLEILQAVVEAAVSEKSPVIVQTSEGAIDYAGLDYLVAMVKVAARAKVPVALHFDHGQDWKIIKQAIMAGYSSVMFDGSTLPYKKNAAKTKKVVALAHRHGVSVEAEIGALPGQEDLVDVKARDTMMTEPVEAARFVAETGCDFLAISIGTAHGARKFIGESRLDYDRLKKIKRLVDLPLVLHGASGVPAELTALSKKYCRSLHDCQRFAGAKGVSDGSIKTAIKYGINKINVDTDLRIAWLTGVRQTIAEKHRVFDSRLILAPAKTLMTEVARHKMRLFGSAGQA